MISSTIEKLIDQVVLDRIGGPAGQSFSAYDITKDVRKLTTEIFYHGDAKGYIHAKLQDSQMFDVDNSGGVYGGTYIVYTRSANVQPATSNPSFAATYPNLNALLVKSFNPVVAPAPAPAVLATVSRTPDARGTISIPKDMVTSLGWKPKDRILAIKSNTKGLILRKATNVAASINKYDPHYYTVDRSYNVRITKSTLDAAGVTRNVVQLKSDKIIVE